MVTSKKVNGKAKSSETQPSSLTISRNKHWRYISAFHGPWLQLPHEILETLAHSNYLSPRPRQTHPAILYDLLKVRKLVDDAADLAVRAQNGTASSALNADNGLPGAALGLNTRGTGGNAKLSPERKYRMRELATQKLAEAYRLDEIAASVATMQSASTLDNVANLVLQRSPSSTDAKYVHFFHEKIPSRMMAEYTPLTTLNEVIAHEPGHAAPYRTRALTKIFKEDFHGAAQDLSEALALCRTEQVRHSAGKNQLVSMKTAREEAEKRRVWTRDWMQDNRVADDDQPRGLELQILFQRGNQWLTIACQHIRMTLGSFAKAQRLKTERESRAKAIGECYDINSEPSNAEIGAIQSSLEQREVVRKFAKRALRDYTAFFSQLDYAFAGAHDADSPVFDRETAIDDDDVSMLNVSTTLPSSGSSSQALVRREINGEISEGQPHHAAESSQGPRLTVYDISHLLSASPPSDLPPFPAPASSAVTLKGSTAASYDGINHREMITYHPLMPEILHSLLLTHCLLQTPQTTLHRIATNASRIARLADGYPFFLSARSPARADWAEILRKTDNWIGLQGTWDSLCKSSSASSPEPSRKPSTDAMSNTTSVSKKCKATKTTEKSPMERSDGQDKNRIHKEAIMGALGDERVVDDESFQKAVHAREKRAMRDMDESSAPLITSESTTPKLSSEGPHQLDGAADNSMEQPSSDTQHTPYSAAEPFGRDRTGLAVVAKDEEYLIGTERAEAIAKWVLEAPAHIDAAAGKTKRKKKGGKKLTPTTITPEPSDGLKDRFAALITSDV